MSRDRAWAVLANWASEADERDMSDEARAWAEAESKLTSRPTNDGEWKASVEMAFEAGRRYERAFALQEDVS